MPCLSLDPTRLAGGFLFRASARNFLKVKYDKAVWGCAPKTALFRYILSKYYVMYSI